MRYLLCNQHYLYVVLDHGLSRPTYCITTLPEGETFSLDDRDAFTRFIDNNDPTDSGLIWLVETSQEYASLGDACRALKAWMDEHCTYPLVSSEYPPKL